MESQYPNKREPLLNFTNISLNYGQLQVLRNVSFGLETAEIHALVGEHGAGKSSLGMIISGVYKPQAGLLTFNGKDYRLLTLQTARKLGIEMVQQHTLSLNKSFTISENFSLTNMPLLIRKQKTLESAVSFLAQYHVELDPSLPVEKFNIPDQIFIDILKHIYPRPRLLILDEALEKLVSANFDKIISILRELKRQGTSILLITHRIDDIYNLADRVSIIKNGEILLTDEIKNIDKINLIKMAYTQISTTGHVGDLNREFYQFLKYNEAILQNLPVNLIITGDENRIKMVNDHCQQSFQLEKPCYVNVPFDQLVTSPHEDVMNQIKDALSAQEGKIFYQVPLIVHGIPIISNLKIFPIYDGALRIGNIVIVEDVTEYDQLQKQVTLSEKLASVGLLAAGVAHEINNPLEVISNSLTYIKGFMHSQELREAIDDIHRAMTGIANIVGNLHSFSDNKQSVTEDIDVNALIQTMLNLIQYNAQYRQIAIRFEPAEQALTIRANKNEIKQVLLNLFKNSFEAMPSGGEIVIQTRPLEEQDANFAQMLFKDTGPGICDENPNNIFLPFYSTKKGTGDNLGLGLSVSYGIITKYHGTITVENIEHVGCQFVITLPQSQ
jgi:signal transduction histidine kinase/ABC-type branched-subunit amino acid transport system ATPase component